MKRLNLKLKIALISVLFTLFITTSIVQTALCSDKPTIKIGYVAWATTTSAYAITAAVLEKIGYNVEGVLLDVGVMYSAVSKADVDLIPSASIPELHEVYFDRFGYSYELLAVTYAFSQQGLGVPTYMKELNSIDQLADYQDQFNGRIIGIGPGSGLMQAASRSLKEYPSLKNYKLIEGSGSAMVGMVKKATSRKKPILATVWRPHWLFLNYPMKILADPKGTYGRPYASYTVGPTGFKKRYPAAAKMMWQSIIFPDELSKLMNYLGVDKMEARAAGRKWVKENEAIVNKWIRGCDEIPLFTGSKYDVEKSGKPWHPTK